MLQIVSPYTQELIKEIPLADKNELEAKLSQAHELFINQEQHLPPHERIRILEKAAQIMEQQVEKLTKIATEEGGKPFSDSKVEVLRAINGVKLAAQEIGQLKGEEVPMGLTAASENRLGFTMREPIGVVAAISAFNHPLNLIVHQAIPAFAAGCPVIVKPALTTPLSCLALIDIMKEAGMPKEWIQPLICNDELAEKLATDNRVNFLTFIGSSKVGWYLRSKVANGTRCAMEHGGIAPVIIEQDADIDQLIPLVTKGGFYHAGQVCVSVQRVYIHESILEEVSKKLVSAAQNLAVGDPLDEKTAVGPLILPKEVNRIKEWVDEAVAEGAQLLCGGNRLDNNCFEPTILLNPPLSGKVSTQEIFGPVICLYSYEDTEDAIKQANDTEMHFQAAIFTSNIHTAIDSMKKVNATAVMINDHTAFRVDWMPFGGRDTSGLGLGGIPHAMKDMTREKLMVIKI